MHPFFQPILVNAKTHLDNLKTQEQQLINVFRQNQYNQNFNFPIDQLQELRHEMALLIYDICALEREWDYYEWIQEVWGWSDANGCLDFSTEDVFDQIKTNNFY